MKKRLLVIASLIGLGVSSLSAVMSNVITPLSFEQKPRTYVHYPFPLETDECSNWTFDSFGVYYQRNACDAFGCNLDCATTNLCDSSCDKVTSHTVPLAQLWFGKAAFTVADAFAGGVIDAPTGNPFLNFTTFSPQLSYNERGAFFGATANRYNLGCCKDWFVSARIGLPVSVVEVNQRNVCDCGDINPDFADTIVTIQQQRPGNGGLSGTTDTRTVHAYRLDLVNSLLQSDGTPMVEFGTNTGTVAGNTRIAGQDITNNQTQVSAQNAARLRGPIYVYKQSSGKVPTAPNGLVNSSTFPPVGQNLMIETSNAMLSAAGNGALADGQWAVFGGFYPGPPAAINDQVDYKVNLGSNPAAQKTLFVVPVENSSATVTWENIGLVVENTIARALQELELSGVNALTFLKEKGIDFGRSECTTGAGDLFIDVWGGKQKECWFADGLIGLRIPTGSKLKNPAHIFAQPNGSNGHLGLKLGAEGGYMPCNWIGLKLEFFWTHFFSATERRAAVFNGAKVRNIGPCVDAKVRWDTFILYADATFFSQICPNVGIDVGYELYAKTKDDLCYCVSQIADFAGEIQSLNSFNARNGSDTQSHKLRAELFKQWGCFQIFFGGSYIVAGKNVMKETEWHLGMKADF